MSDILGAGAIIGGLAGLYGANTSSDKAVGYQGSIPYYEAVRAQAPFDYASEARGPGELGRQYFTNTVYSLPQGVDPEALNLPTGINIPSYDEARQAVLEQADILAEGGNAYDLPYSTMGLTSFVPSASSINQSNTQNNLNIATYATELMGVRDSIVNIFDNNFGIAPDGDTMNTLIRAYINGATIDEIEEIINGYQDPNQDAGQEYARGGSVAGQGYYLGGMTDGMADEVPASINGQQEAALSDGEFVIPADVVGHLGNGNSNAGAQQLYDMMDRIRQARTGSEEQGSQINPNKFLPR